MGLMQYLQSLFKITYHIILCAHAALVIYKAKATPDIQSMQILITAASPQLVRNG